ncbi:MAG: DUF6655 family protein [Pirellulaceae bacterium]
MERSFVLHPQQFHRATTRSTRCWRSFLCLWLVLLLASVGCGLNKSRLATEQLIVSDAVDQAVAAIDFSPLSGSKVYFDTKYLDGVKLTPVGNVEYVVSSLRQQMAAYDCRLQDKPEEADFIVEARVGVMSHDSQELTYGIPGSAALSTASVFLAAPIPAPAMPELSLGRRNHQQGTAKIGVFAYDRQTREPVWQAGVTKAATRSRDLWILGLGPFESHSPVRNRKGWFGRRKDEIGVVRNGNDSFSNYAGAVVFERAIERQTEAAATPEVQTAGFEQQATAEAEGKSTAADTAKAEPAATE